jgi:nitrite reductase/ring-hydroxylating ferredoxin subunit
MITQEENELLTQTGAGTPCGELMRPYWQPAALSEELSADRPLPVQLFGEELILFRDGAGKPALIGRYCAHQGVDMIYGRAEEDGLRCMYHGWLFDNCGKVVLRGDWLPEKERRWDVGQAAHPCVEAGGVIFTYMGLGEAPLLPAYEFLALPAESCAVTKALHSDNYLPALGAAADPAPGLSRFILPNLTLFQAEPPGAESVVRWHVPVDDQSYLEYTFQFAGELRSANEPRTVAHDVLLRAVQEIPAERNPPDESSEKIL